MGFYQIDELTGEISVTQAFVNAAIYQGVNHLLEIKVYDQSHTELYDLANVSITVVYWDVNRNGASLAPAVSSSGCTIEDLAKDIGLETNEFQNWLIFNQTNVFLENGMSVSANSITAHTRLGANQSFSIPNTIYMAWFGEVGGLGKTGMKWYANINELGNLGFNVIQFDNDSYGKDCATEAKRDFVRGIESLAETKSLCGLYMMGHGSNQTIGSLGTNSYTVAPDWSIPYGNITSSVLSDDSATWTIGIALEYKLAAVIIHACYGDNNKSRRLVSSDGIFWGVDRVYEPIIVDHVEYLSEHWGHAVTYTGTLFSPWEHTIGGKLRTNSYRVLLDTPTLP